MEEKLAIILGTIVIIAVMSPFITVVIIVAHFAIKYW